MLDASGEPSNNSIDLFTSQWMRAGRATLGDTANVFVLVPSPVTQAPPVVTLPAKAMPGDDRCLPSSSVALGLGRNLLAGSLVCLRLATLGALSLALAGLWLGSFRLGCFGLRGLSLVGALLARLGLIDG